MVSTFAEKRVGLLIELCIWGGVSASGIDFPIPIAVNLTLESGNGLLKRMMRVNPVMELSDRV